MPPGDVDGFADAIRRLHEMSPEQRREVGAMPGPRASRFPCDLRAGTRPCIESSDPAAWRATSTSNNRSHGAASDAGLALVAEEAPTGPDGDGSLTETTGRGGSATRHDQRSPTYLASVVVRLIAI